MLSVVFLIVGAHGKIVRHHTTETVAVTSVAAVKNEYVPYQDQSSLPDFNPAGDTCETQKVCPACACTQHDGYWMCDGGKNPNGRWNCEEGISDPETWCSDEAVAGCQALTGGEPVTPEILADRLWTDEWDVEDFYRGLGLGFDGPPTCSELCTAVVGVAGAADYFKRGELVPNDAEPADDEVDEDDDDEVAGDPGLPHRAAMDAPEDPLERTLAWFGVMPKDEPEAEEPAAPIVNGVQMQKLERRSSRGSKIDFGPPYTRDEDKKAKMSKQRQLAAQQLDVAIDALSAKSPTQTTKGLVQQYLGKSDSKVFKETLALLKTARRAVGKQRYEGCKDSTSSSTKAYVMVWRSGKKGDRVRKFLRSEKSGSYYITHLCPGHWRSNRDTVTRAGTVVHESTHHAGAGDKRRPTTGRRAYSYNSVLALAHEDQWLAQRNAQSLRYLVWDLARHAQ